MAKNFWRNWAFFEQRQNPMVSCHSGLINMNQAYAPNHTPRLAKSTTAVSSSVLRKLFPLLTTQHKLTKTTHSTGTRERVNLLDDSKGGYQ